MVFEATHIRLRSPDPALATVSERAEPSLTAGAQLLLRWAGNATKSPSFAQCVTNLFPKARELGSYMHDDECDHGYWPTLKSSRSI